MRGAVQRVRAVWEEGKARAAAEAGSQRAQGSSRAQRQEQIDMQALQGTGKRQQGVQTARACAFRSK